MLSSPELAVTPCVFFSIFSAALVPSKRADGLSLRPFFDHSIGGLDLHWGIANGYLVDIHAFAVRTTTDIAALPTRMQVSRRHSCFCCPYCWFVVVVVFL